MFDATQAIYSLFTGLSAFAFNAGSLMLLRFLAVIGLGAALPIAHLLLIGQNLAVTPASLSPLGEIARPPGETMAFDAEPLRRALERPRRGHTNVELGAILVLVSIVSIAVLGAIGGNMAGFFAAMAAGF